MLKEYLKLPMFLYAVVREVLSRIKLVKVKSNIPLALLSIIITALLLVPTILFMLTLQGCRAVVDLRLRQIYKESYRGLMGGIDSLCCQQDNCVPLMLTLVEFKGGVEELKGAIVKQLQNIMSSKHKKLFYSRGEYMGYHFYFKEDIPAEDYTVVMETNEKVIDNKKISEIFMPYNKSHMPCNDRKLTQVLICPQPVQSDDKQVYCIIYRTHHCVGDGKVALDLVKACYADNDGKVATPKIIVEKPKVTFEKIKQILNNMSIKSLPFTARDRNALRGYKLTENKHIVWFSDSGFDCINKIRHIKNCNKGVTFLDVMNTCLSLSFYDYYKKRDLPIPDIVMSALTLRVGVTNFTGYGSNDFEVENNFSIASIQLPISLQFKPQGDKIKGMLNFLQNEYASFRKSLDIHFVYYVTQNIGKLLPTQILSWLSNWVEFTIGISSIPGLDEITFFGGNTVRDIVLFPPNSPGTGLHILFTSYKGHLRITLTADSSVTPTHEDAQEIVDGITTHLDKLHTLYCNYK